MDAFAIFMDSVGGLAGIAALIVAIVSLRKTRSEVRKADADAGKSRAETMKLVTDAAGTVVGQLRTQYEEMSEDLEAHHIKLEKQQADISKLQADLAEAKADLNAARVTIARQESQLTESRRNIEVLTDDMRSLSIYIDTLLRGIAVLVEQIRERGDVPRWQPPQKPRTGPLAG